MNIQLAPDGAIHVKRFSWHTACGKEIDIDSNRVMETSDPVTCGKCLNQRNYLYVKEFAGFGVLIDRDAEHTDRINDLRDMWNADEIENGDILPYRYLIKIFVQFQGLGQEALSMVASLPDDEAALNLAETFIRWRIGLLQGYIVEVDWDAIKVKEPA